MPLCIQCKQFIKQCSSASDDIFLFIDTIVTFELIKSMVPLAFHCTYVCGVVILAHLGDNLSPSVVFSDVFLLYMGCNQINVITPLANGYLKLPKKLINCQIFYSHGRYATYNILEKSTPTNSADFFTTVKTSVDPTNVKNHPFGLHWQGFLIKKISMR